jgi:hypothetical protein
MPIGKTLRLKDSQFWEIGYKLKICGRNGPQCFRFRARQFASIRYAANGCLFAPHNGAGECRTRRYCGSG